MGESHVSSDTGAVDAGFVPGISKDPPCAWEEAEEEAGGRLCSHPAQLSFPRRGNHKDTSQPECPRGKLPSLQMYVNKLPGLLVFLPTHPQTIQMG